MRRHQRLSSRGRCKFKPGRVGAGKSWWRLMLACSGWPIRFEPLATVSTEWANPVERRRRAPVSLGIKPHRIKGAWYDCPSSHFWKAWRGCRSL